MSSHEEHHPVVAGTEESDVQFDVSSQYALRAGKTVAALGLIELADSIIVNDTVRNVAAFAGTALMSYQSLNVLVVPVEGRRAKRDTERFRRLQTLMPQPAVGHSFYESGRQLSLYETVAPLRSSKNADEYIPGSKGERVRERLLYYSSVHPYDRLLAISKSMVFAYRAMWRQQEADGYMNGLKLLENRFPTSKDGEWAQFIADLANKRDFAQRVSECARTPRFMTFGHESEAEAEF